MQNNTTGKPYVLIGKSYVRKYTHIDTSVVYISTSMCIISKFCN